MGSHSPVLECAYDAPCQAVAEIGTGDSPPFCSSDFEE